LRSFFNFSLLVFSLLLYSECTSASHLLGADMVYKCHGNGLYQITVKVYRDCNGIKISNSPVSIDPLDCKISGQTFTLWQDEIKDITPVCPSVRSKCDNGTYEYGVEEYTFRGMIDLSSYKDCCKFRISWSQSARSGGITTGQANQEFYTEALVDKCITPCNSSPQITNAPVVIMCAGQDFSFNNGILDSIDGDSLSFSLEAPLQQVGNPCNYAPGFSKNSPLKYLGFGNPAAPLPAGFHLDPGNGDLNFRPIEEQSAVIVIQVKEWRRINGVFLNVGTTRRDMEIIVTSSGVCNIPPLLPPVISRSVCVGEKLSFDIYPADPDPGDTVTLSWNHAIGGATFTTTATQSGSEFGTFTWTPGIKDSSSWPYYFTVTATDNACPFRGKTTRAYSIRVNPSPHIKIVGPDACFPDSNTFTDASSVANGSVLLRRWRLGDGTTTDKPYLSHLYPSFGSYDVWLKVIANSGCIDSAMRKVKYSTNAIAGFDILRNCSSLTDTFFNTSHVKGGSIKSALWSFGDNTFSEEYSPVKTYSNKGIYKVKLIVNSDQGCRDTMEKTNGVVVPVAAFTSTQTACSNDSVVFTNTSDYLEPAKFSWYVDGKSFSSDKDPFYKFPKEGTYSLSLSIHSYRCSDSTGKAGYMNVFPTPGADFSASPDSTSILKPVVVFTNRSYNGQKYYWDFDEHSAKSSAINPVYEFRDTGTHWVSLLVDNDFGCSSIARKKIRIEEVFSFFIPNSFSPNGDLVNDHFIPGGKGIADCRTSIYNRWGELIFSGNKKECWNGGMNNHFPVVQDGVYVYQIEVTDFRGREYFYSGVVHLLK
jgi:gliding motility-associated-like protein